MRLANAYAFRVLDNLAQGFCASIQSKEVPIFDLIAGDFHITSKGLSPADEENPDYSGLFTLNADLIRPEYHSEYFTPEEVKLWEFKARINSFEPVEEEEEAKWQEVFCRFLPAWVKKVEVVHVENFYKSKKSYSKRDLEIYLWLELLEIFLPGPKLKAFLEILEKAGVTINIAPGSLMPKNLVEDFEALFK